MTLYTVANTKDEYVVLRPHETQQKQQSDKTLDAKSGEGQPDSPKVGWQFGNCLGRFLGRKLLSCFVLKQLSGLKLVGCKNPILAGFSSTELPRSPVPACDAVGQICCD